MSQFEVALLLGMASITFAIRYTLFAVGDRVRFSPLVQQALGYVPVAVLTAIIVPAMLMPGGEGLEVTPSNAYLVGGVVAVLIAAFSRNLLLTIFGSMLVFFLWRWWLFG